MMKPKGIRKPGIGSHKPSHGYSGIAIDILSSITVTQTRIEETVEVTTPTEPTETISESVVVAVTP